MGSGSTNGGRVLALSVLAGVAMACVMAESAPERPTTNPPAAVEHCLRNVRRVVTKVPFRLRILSIEQQWMQQVAASIAKVKSWLQNGQRSDYNPAQPLDVTSPVWSLSSTYRKQVVG